MRLHITRRRCRSHTSIAAFLSCNHEPLYFLKVEQTKTGASPRSTSHSRSLATRQRSSPQLKH